MTTLFYKALILQGEIWGWSLLGLKSTGHVKHICLPSIISNFTHKKDELKKKTVKFTSFQKPQLQSVLIFV